MRSNGYRREVLLPILTDLGTDHRCYKIARSLVLRGYRPVIFCDKPLTRPGNTWKDIEIHTLTNSSHRDAFLKAFLVFHLKLLPWIWRGRKAVWIVEDCPPLLSVALWGRLLGFRVYYDAHEIFPEVEAVMRTPFRRFFWSTWHDWGVRLSKAVITVSPEYCRYYEERFSRPVAYAPNAAPAQREKFYSFEPWEDAPKLPKIPVQSRASNQPEPPPWLLIFQGHLRKDASLEWVMEAIARDERFHLTIIGDGSERRSLESLAGRLHLESRVCFTGALPFDKVPPMLANHHIGVNLLRGTSPSIEKTLGNKVFDYLGAGLPQLLGRTSALLSFARENPVGLVVEDYTAEAVAEALNRLVTDYDTYRFQCRELQAKHSWEAYEKNWLSLLDT